MLKKLRLAEEALRKGESQIYPALITRVKPFSLFFEIPRFDLEGSLHVSEIGGDYYEYNEKTMTLFGKRTGRSFTIGKPIQVILTQVDLVQMRAEWSLRD